MYPKERFKDDLCEFAQNLKLPVDVIARIVSLESYYYKGAFELLKKYGATASDSKTNPKVFIIPFAKLQGNPVIMVEFEVYLNGRKRKVGLVGESSKTWKVDGKQRTEPAEFTAYRAYKNAMKHWLRHPISEYCVSKRDDRKNKFYMVEMPYEELMNHLNSIRTYDFDDASPKQNPKQKEKMLIQVDDLISDGISWNEESAVVFYKISIERAEGKV